MIKVIWEYILRIIGKPLLNEDFEIRVAISKGNVSVYQKALISSTKLVNCVGICKEDVTGILNNYELITNSVKQLIDSWFDILILIILEIWNKLLIYRNSKHKTLSKHKTNSI